MLLAQSLILEQAITPSRTTAGPARERLALQPFKATVLCQYQRLTRQIL